MHAIPSFAFLSKTTIIFIMAAPTDSTHSAGTAEVEAQSVDVANHTQTQTSQSVQQSTGSSSAAVDFTAAYLAPETVYFTSDGTGNTNALQTSHPSIQRQRKRILRFNNDEIRLLYLHSVRTHEAHKFERGKKYDVFVKVLHTFWQHLLVHIRDVPMRPTVKSLKDRLRTMMADIKAFNSFL